MRGLDEIIQGHDKMCLESKITHQESRSDKKKTWPTAKLRLLVASGLSGALEKPSRASGWRGDNDLKELHRAAGERVKQRREGFDRRRKRIAAASIQQPREKHKGRV